MTKNSKLPSNFRSNANPSLNITESMIKNIVDSFYTKVKNDPLIGPIFEAKFGNDWDHHLEQMYNFWSGVILSTGRYKGQPMSKHINLQKLQKEHFIRWLLLFEENVYSTCSKEIAELFVNKANKIGDSLMIGIDFHRKNLNI